MQRKGWLEPPDLKDTLEGTWVDVHGQAGRYLVSTMGEVVKSSYTRGQTRGRKLEGFQRPDGYVSVGTMLKPDHSKSWLLHRLVLMSHSPVDDMDTLTVNHINGIKSDNRLANLEWATHPNRSKGIPVVHGREEINWGLARAVATRKTWKHIE